MFVHINRTWTYQKTVAQFVITSLLHMELVQVIHSNRFREVWLIGLPQCIYWILWAKIPRCSITPYNQVLCMCVNQIIPPNEMNGLESEDTIDSISPLVPPIWCIWCCDNNLNWDLVGYSLVNVYITMENHHVQWVNPLFLWPFSIAFCMFTRGYVQKFYAQLANSMYSQWM